MHTRLTFFSVLLALLSLMACLVGQGCESSANGGNRPRKTNSTPTNPTPTNSEDISIETGDTAAVPTSCINEADSPGLVTSIIVQDKVTHTSLHNTAKYLVTQNKQGIFFTYSPKRYESDLEGGEVSVEGSETVWRLMKVNPDCQGFTQLFEETCKICNAPAVESDDDGNLFLANGDPDSANWSLAGPRDARLFKFLASSGYKNPEIFSIPKGNSDKFRLVYDKAKKKLFYYNYNEQPKIDPRKIFSFYSISLDGTIESSIPLNGKGDTARIMYPHLAVDDSRVVAIWHTERGGISTTEPRLYRNISFIYSDDSGLSWKNFSGAPTQYPVINDNRGPGTMVTLKEEEGDHNWLGDAVLKNNKLHISYQIWGVMHPGNKTHYVRYNFENGTRDVDIQPDWNGIAGQGHFVNDRRSPNGPIYIVSTKNSNGGSVLAVLISSDEGKTWQPFAEGQLLAGDPDVLDTIQTLHEVTSDGYIVGLYSRCNARPEIGRCGTYVNGQWIYDSRAYFFKVKAK